MIQGGNGSGKTNLIRWLKEKYEAATDRSEEAVILISRAHNNLQDAMTQLLESGIFPEEVRDRTIKLLQNARGNVSVSDFKRLINFKFVLEIENDKSQSTLDQRTKDRLARYLQNPFILNTFLMQDGGPLDRIRARIETTDESVVVDGDAPVFLPEDFEISISQISTGLRRMDDKADQATIWMAEQFSNASKGRGTREAVANYLSLFDFPLAESFYENYYEFEDLVSRAAKESLLSIKTDSVETEEARKSIAEEKIKKVFGPLSVWYVIDGEPVDGSLGTDDSFFTELLFDLLLGEVINEINHML